MTRNRAFRRWQEKVAKQKTLRLYLQLDMDKPPLALPEAEYRQKWVGMMTHCHRSPCSCFMCGNPRQGNGDLTLAEKRSWQRFREAIREEKISI